MRTGIKLQSWVAGISAALLTPAIAVAYPGGTPSYQTDAAPFCASCHSSRNVEMLEGAGERAEKYVAERKHIAVILSGQKGYQGQQDQWQQMEFFGEMERSKHFFLRWFWNTLFLWQITCRKKGCLNHLLEGG